MAMKFTTNRFARVFLNDWSAFKYDITEYPSDGNGIIWFEWAFNQYSGHGKIYIKNGKLCDGIGNDYSEMVVSFPRVKGIKRTDTLYNDPDLAIVFENIIKGFDL